MKYFLAASFAIVFSASAQASDEAVFNSPSELMPYCQREAAAQLGAKGVPTYQWSARHHMQGAQTNKIRIDGIYDPGGFQSMLTGKPFSAQSGYDIFA